MLLDCGCLGELLRVAVQACALREVDALKAALAFLVHCVKLPVADAAAAEVGAPWHAGPQHEWLQQHASEAYAG